MSICHHGRPSIHPKPKMAEYDMVVKGSLKLKNNSDGVFKKKKKKDKDVKKILEQVAKVSSNEDSCEKSPEVQQFRQPALTKAEKAFQKMQEKKQMERILKIASKSHKQRVEEFNKHLDSLTEHYDIPKVSWTK